MAKTSAEPVLKLPGFRYGGFEVPAIALDAALVADLGTAEPAYKLAPKSAPLAWKVGLYVIGRDLALYGDSPPSHLDALPEPVKAAGRAVYARCQEKRGEGTWHRDGVLFLNRSDAPKGMAQPNDETYVFALYFTDIEGFEEKDGVWRPKPSPQTTEHRIWLPSGDGNYIVPAPNEGGAYNPITGTPFETVKNRKEALRRWLDSSLTEEQTRKELSRFYRKNEGTAAVYSWSYAEVGPLSINLSDEPLNRDFYLGSFPAVVAERSEAGPQTQLRNLAKQLPDE